MKMTTEEAFVKVLQMQGIEHAFGIIGSAGIELENETGNMVTIRDIISSPLQFVEQNARSE